MQIEDYIDKNIADICHNNMRFNHIRDRDFYRLFRYNKKYKMKNFFMKKEYRKKSISNGVNRIYKM